MRSKQNGGEVNAFIFQLWLSAFLGKTLKYTNHLVLNQPKRYHYPDIIDFWTASL
jgi:hypothetical protein